MLAPHRLCAVPGPCSGRSDATRPPASFPILCYLVSPGPLTTSLHTRPTSGQPGTPVPPAECAHFVRRSSKKLSGTPCAHNPLQQSWQVGRSCIGRAVRAQSSSTHCVPDIHALPAVCSHVGARMPSPDGPARHGPYPLHTCMEDSDSTCHQVARAHSLFPIVACTIDQSSHRKHPYPPRRPLCNLCQHPRQ